MSDPLVSICIPAYKEPELLVRTLRSIIDQDHKNIEIVISDDSPDESVKIAITPYMDQANIRYVNNQPALKSPANWNAALDLGKGDLKMLMHHDDWFHTSSAVSTFVKAFDDPFIDGVFCQNTAIDQDGRKMILQMIPSILHSMKTRPDHLVRFNVIGPPSNLMVRSSVSTRYDTRFIWLVDVDYLVRLLKAGHRLRYLEQHLVSIGLHEAQTTAYCMANQHIIVKENMMFAQKVGNELFDDILVYDYYWRFLRNQQILNEAQLVSTGISADEIPAAIRHMLKAHRRYGHQLLKNGIVSKSMMFLNYLTWKMRSK